MNQPQANPIPDGYMQDAKGALWPVATMRQIDITRDELVYERVGDSEQYQPISLDIAAV